MRQSSTTIRSSPAPPAAIAGDAASRATLFLSLPAKPPEAKGSRFLFSFFLLLSIIHLLSALPRHQSRAMESQHSLDAAPNSSSSSFFFPSIFSWAKTSVVLSESTQRSADSANHPQSREQPEPYFVLLSYLSSCSLCPTASKPQMQRATASMTCGRCTPHAATSQLLQPHPEPQLGVAGRPVNRQASVFYFFFVNLLLSSSFSSFSWNRGVTLFL